MNEQEHMKDPIAPRPEEMAAAADWWGAHLAGDAWPFSFRLDGHRVDGPAGGWQVERTGRPLDECREELTITARHGGHGLVVRCEAVRYRDFPAVEWTVELDQTAQGRAPLVSDLMGLDAEWQHGEKTDFLLRSYRGDDHEQRNIYEPSITNLWAGRRVEFAPTSWSGTVSDGRASSGAFPYCAVEEAGSGDFAARPVTGGFLLAIGWPGRWRAEFIRDGRTGLRIRAGQDQTRFRLRPGESFRSPLIALLFFEGGDRIRTQNLWRRWMIAHNLPRPGGRLPRPMLEASTCGFFDEMGRADEANQIEYIDRYRAAQLPITHWWMDAGWYPCWLDNRQKNCWWITGTWEPDRKRFPRGLRAITDHAHRHGIGNIVWFEPERAAPDTWLARERPQWLLRRSGANLPGPVNSWANFQLQDENGILNLGNPEALEWLIERVSSLVRSEGIDVYRQDFNINPLPNWRLNDPAEREGMAENLHTCGYLAYWDALRQRFPDLLLDSCASGGRRNDLETLRRSVALHPTDHRYDDLTVKQTIRHSLFQWLPFFGGPVMPLDKVDVYAFRSTMGLSTCIGFDLRRKDLDLALLRRLMREWHEVAPLFCGDFYPLTSYSLNDDAWMAWQFHRPGEGDGLVQAFRRPASPHDSASFALSGLDAEAVYEVKDYDQPSPVRRRGAELLAGLRVEMPQRPQSRTIRYRRVSESGGTP
jgi:alpha-galactosidase